MCLHLRMTEGRSNLDNSTIPASTHKMGAETGDSGSRIESPTPETPESGRKSIPISSLAANLLAERYKDRLAEQLFIEEDETAEESDSDSVSPAVSPSSVSESADTFAVSPKERPAELPEKHKDLLNLFNQMESSVRLLRLRKKMTTFKNIATQVEVLTKRKFLYTHLAQMKHLFPEAIQINRILLHDDKSLCMYPEMEITLIIDAVECRNPNQSHSMALCDAFHSKLLSFVESHHKSIQRAHS